MGLPASAEPRGGGPVSRAASAALDEHIVKTAAKKRELLRVVEKPYLPLTSNPAK